MGQYVHLSQLLPVSAAAPLMPGERIITLDIIRGFALLGILVMNLPSFSGSGWYLFNEVDPNSPWWDDAAQQVRNVLFDGKFNSLFSFLFALGFTIQLQRLHEREPLSATRIYLRRLMVLFLLGWLHAVLFWTGDILHMYAVMGLVLLLIRNWSDRALYTLLAACLLAPGIRSLGLAMFESPQRGLERVQVIREMIARADVAYGQGTYSDAVSENAAQMFAQYSTWMNIEWTSMFYLVICATMILGLIAGRRQWLHQASSHIELIRKVQWWSLGLGLLVAAISSAVTAKTDPGEASIYWVIYRVSYGLARVILMVFYLATIVRLAQHLRWQRWMAPLAAAGRMPLSNYLAQTLLCTFIFYNWGLGYWKTTGSAAELFIAFGIFFGLQVPLSMWWLSKYRYGPMEYLWRGLTYGFTATTAAYKAVGK